MEVAARDDVSVFEHQRVVGDGIQLGFQHTRGVGQGVPARTVHLRHAPQAVGILYAATVAVGIENLAQVQ